MNKLHYFIAVLLGLILPFVGLFFGLQVSTTVGNVLAFPLILFSKILGVPFGMFSRLEFAMAIALSIFCWGGLYLLLVRFIRIKKQGQT